MVSTLLRNISQIGSSSQLVRKIKLMVQTTNQYSYLNIKPSYWSCPWHHLAWWASVSQPQGPPIPSVTLTLFTGLLKKKHSDSRNTPSSRNLILFFCWKVTYKRQGVCQTFWRLKRREDQSVIYKKYRTRFFAYSGEFQTYPTHSNWP